jgi:hypothetical protein
MIVCPTAAKSIVVIENITVNTANIRGVASVRHIPLLSSLFIQLLEQL